MFGPEMSIPLLLPILRAVCGAPPLGFFLEDYSLPLRAAPVPPACFGMA